MSVIDSDDHSLKANKPADLVKTPHKAQTWTAKQIEEISRCMDPVTGPEYFMSNFFSIQHPTRGAMLYRPYEYQKRLIHTYHNYRYSISLMPRQTGKSTSAAGYLLWYAMFVPDSTILIAAHKYTGAQEIMQRIRYAYESCPDHIRAGSTSYNKGSLEFENGSRIVSATTTENTGRGMSISLIYMDEFSFVRPTIAAEFWTSIAPTLATGGKCIITSTPNNDEDKFAEIWKQANKTEDAFGNTTDVGINGFKAFESHWSEHPDRDESWATAMRAQLGDEKFEREILCRFVSADETLVAPMKLATLEAEDPIENKNNIRWFKRPRPGRSYVVALDPSLGTGSDPAAIQVFEADTTEQIAEWKHNKTAIPEQVRILAKICDEISAVTGKPDSTYYSIERNGVGEAAVVSLLDYGEENIKGYFLSERGKRRGFNTTATSKKTSCSKLKNLIENDKMKVRSGSLIRELKNFVRSGEGTFKAKPGETDDLVMSTVLAVRMMTELQFYDAAIDKQMRDHVDNYSAPLPFIAMIR